MATPLALVLLLAALMNGFWAWESVFPPPLHNTHEHLAIQADILATWELSPLQALRDHAFGDGYHPPLLHFATALARSVLGPSPLVLHGIGTGLYLLFILGTWCLGRLLLGRRGALLAAALTGAMPIVIGLSRLHDPTLLMATLSLWCVVLLLAARRGAGWSAPFAAGLLLAAALLSERVVALIYVAGPLAWTVFARPASLPPPSRRLVHSLLAGCLIAAIVTAPFHLWFLEQHVLNLDHRSAMLDYEHGEHPGWWRPDNLLYYVLVLPDNQLHPFLSLLLLLGLLRLGRLPEQARSFLAWWTLPPLLLFTALLKKNTIYTAPLLPAAGLLCAHGILSIRTSTPRRVASVLCPVLAAGLALAGSFWPGAGNLGTRLSYGIVQEEEWLRPPLSAREESAFVSELAREIGHTSPHQPRPFVVSLHSSAPEGASSVPRPSSSHELYSYRRSMELFLRYERPSIRLLSSSGLEGWHELRGDSPPPVGVLVFVESGAPAWPSLEELAGLETRFSEHLPPAAVEPSRRLLEGILEDPPKWSRTLEFTSVHGFEVHLYRPVLRTGRFPEPGRPPDTDPP